MSTARLVALQAASLSDGQAAPEWVHLVPAGTFRGADGRGPYQLADAGAVLAASLPSGARLAIDENHATDLAAPKGEPAPARGWIVALESRTDGIWGRVEWTGAGRALVEDRAYRHLSPAIQVERATGRILKLVRASLVNAPNLDLASLHHQDTDMDLHAELRAALGLAETADDAAIIAAVTALKTGVSTHAAQLAPIAAAVGLAAQASATEILGAVNALRDPARMVPASQVTELQTQFTALQQTVAKDKAIAAVDGAITAGKPGIKPLRDHYIARHMADPAAVERELAAMPSLHSGPLPVIPASATLPAVDAEESRAVALMGIDPEAYRKSKAEVTKTETL